MSEVQNEAGSEVQAGAKTQALYQWSFEDEVKLDKELRVALDNTLQALKPRVCSRERALCMTKLQEAIMWLGMDLKRLGTSTPYPNSYNPANTIIDPTADGLKF